MDVSRAALRMGARSPACVSRIARGNASFQEEIERRFGGNQLRPSLRAEQFLGEGKVTGLEVTKCISVFDENKFFNPNSKPDRNS
jgi:hypothetical protein